MWFSRVHTIQAEKSLGNQIFCKVRELSGKYRMQVKLLSQFHIINQYFFGVSESRLNLLLYLKLCLHWATFSPHPYYVLKKLRTLLGRGTVL